MQMKNKFEETVLVIPGKSLIGMVYEGKKIIYADVDTQGNFSSPLN